MDHRLITRPDSVAEASLYLYDLPVDPPLPIGRHGASSRRRGLLIRLSDRDGCHGWGEAAPLESFSEESLGEVVEAARAWIHTRLDRGPASLAFGLDVAGYDLRAGRNGRSLAYELGAHRSDVAVNALVRPAESVQDAAQRIVRHGYSAVKVKVGGLSENEDAVRITSLRETLPDAVAIRLDANRAWSVEEASSFMKRLELLDIEYVEEPLRNSLDLQELSRATRMRIALDETTREIEPSELEQFAYCSAVVLKPTLMGGIERFRSFVEAAERLGMKVVVSSAFESGVGTRALAALAAGTLESAAAGLDPYLHLRVDTLDSPIAIVNGRITLGDAIDRSRPATDRLRRIEWKNY